MLEPRTTVNILVFVILAAATWGCGGGEPAAPSGESGPEAQTVPSEPEPEPEPELVIPTLADLDGTAWVLRALRRGQGVPLNPEVTLAFEGSRIAGSSGCNRYSGEMVEAEPGSVSVGPLATTRMACDEAAMELESAFLELLGKVDGVELRFGSLTLWWRDEEEREAMIFVRATAPAGASTE
jgi:heat shock protein HslJ